MGSGRPYASPSSAKLCGGCVIGGLCIFSLRSLGFGGGGGGGGVSRCNLSRYLADGSAARLIELDLKNCELSHVPPVIASFTSLRHLDLGRNGLTNLPPLPPNLEVCFCYVFRLTMLTHREQVSLW